MRKILIPMVILSLVLGVFAQENPLKRADELVANRENPQQVLQAMEILKKEMATHPYEAGWRYLKAAYYFGKKCKDKNRKIKVYQEAIKIGEDLVKKYPDKVEGHFWLGVVYGVYGEARGVMKSLFLVKPIKRQMKEVLRLDPQYNCGGAQRVLGRLYYKVPGLFGGSKTKSLEYLRESKKICPNSLLTRIYLAETLIAKGKKKEAKAELEEALTLEPVPTEKPEEEQYKAQIKELLSKLR